MLFANPVPGVIHPKGWQRPSGNLDYVQTQPFGCTGVVYEPPLGSCNHFHRGNDFGNGHCGGAILAARDGTVFYAGTLTDGAKVVGINHGAGWTTTYGHLATILVAKGAHVVKGQKIGTCGQTGNATACHLHFSVKSGMPTNPTIAQCVSTAIGDNTGKWEDAWSRLEQNVTIRINASGVFVRTSPDLSDASRYAQTKDDGNIHRILDGANLGATSAMRKWGGTVTGASYTIGANTSNKWERIWIAGAYRYVASLLTTKSAS